MEEKTHTLQKLPLPNWCFVLLGVPTFYMPLAYLALAVWATTGMLTGVAGGPPELMKAAVHPALYVTFAMWPVYIAWVGLSKRLTRREKGMWLFIVILANMVGMPMFYVFMIRRYLGVEGRTGKRDEISLDRFLKCHEIAREQLSLAQLSVLRSYCRKHRLTKWGVVPLVAVAALAFYTAVFFVPKNCVRLFADFTPTRVVIVDSTTDSKKEIAPNSEAQKLHVQNVMMVGAMAGMIGAMGLFALAQVMSQLWGNWHRKAFIDFLKATDKEHAQSARGS